MAFILMSFVVICQSSIRFHGLNFSYQNNFKLHGIIQPDKKNSTSNISNFLYFCQMKSKQNSKSHSKRHKRLLIIAAIILFIAGGVAFYITRNLNTVLTEKIMEVYNRADVHNFYNLQFKNLKVNIFTGNVRIGDVHFIPRNKEKAEWFSRNGSIRLDVERITITGADIIDFIKNDRIDVGKFKIKNADLFIDNRSESFMPFAFIRKKKSGDSTNLKIRIGEIRFAHTRLIYNDKTNPEKENHLDDLNLIIQRLEFNKSHKNFMFSVEKFMITMNTLALSTEAIKELKVKHFALNINKIALNNNSGKYEYSYDDFYILLKNPSLITADNRYNISMKQAEIDYIKKSVSLSDINLKPLISKKKFARSFKYRHPQASLSVKNADIYQMDFSKLTYEKMLFADSLVLHDLDVNLYSDGTKPIDTTRFPDYPGKQILTLKQPLNIGSIIVRNAVIHSRMKKKRGGESFVDITDVNAIVTNVQNQKSEGQLNIEAYGKIQSSIPFEISLAFDYGYNRYSFNGHVGRSDLSSLSRVVASFAPVTISSGKIKRMDFKGKAGAEKTEGTMTFLYNDLHIEMQTGSKEKKKGFQNKFLSAVANSYLYLNNPAEPDMPPREVNFHVERDMNKSFINLLIKGLLAGIKESIIPSKENRKLYRQNRKPKGLSLIHLNDE